MSITTTLHHYRFDIGVPEQAEAYKTLREQVLSKIGFPVWTMRFFGVYQHDRTLHDFMGKVRASAGACELETECLFANQWNSTKLRLFNWAECVYPNKNIREGYYLDQTAEMREVLRNTNKCGYCGKMEPAAKGYVFCPHCIDSEYLTEKELHLTRMVPVCDTDKKRAPLTDGERAHLVPIFQTAQIEGATARGKARIAKQRKSVAAEYRKSVADAKEKRDAAIWIMDNVPGIFANWIFYDHSGKHCFGWRKELDTRTCDMLLRKISEFPFSYEIKRDDGTVLRGER